MGKTSEQVASHFEDQLQKVESLELRDAELRKEISHLTRSKTASRKALSNLRKEVERTEKRRAKEQSKLESELKRRMAEFNVTRQEVEEVGRLKACLRGINLDLATLTNLAKEFANGNEEY